MQKSLPRMKEIAVSREADVAKAPPSILPGGEGSGEDYVV